MLRRTSTFTRHLQCAAQKRAHPAALSGTRQRALAGPGSTSQHDKTLRPGLNRTNRFQRLSGVIIVGIELQRGFELALPLFDVSLVAIDQS